MNKRRANASPLIGKMAYVNTQWRVCGIWLACECGERYTLAHVIGACGVHPVTHGGVTRYQLWHVSHVPTGRTIAMRQHAADAMVIAEALATADGMNSTSTARVRALVGQVIGV